MPVYFLGIGSNIDPHANIPRIVRALLALSPTLALSRIVRTAPVGLADDGGDFLNLVARMTSDLPPAALKARLTAIEVALGRDRSDPRSKKLSRPADIDIVLALPDAATVVDAADLPDEPYTRPMLLELLHTCQQAAASLRVPSLPAGDRVRLGDLTLGSAPLTLHCDPQTQQIRQVDYSYEFI